MAADKLQRVQSALFQNTVQKEMDRALEAILGQMEADLFRGQPVITWVGSCPQCRRILATDHRWEVEYVVAPCRSTIRHSVQSCPGWIRRGTEADLAAYLLGGEEAVRGLQG